MMRRYFHLALLALLAILVDGSAYAQVNPVYRQIQSGPHAGDATQQQQITIPSGFGITLQSGASIVCQSGATCPAPGGNGVFNVNSYGAVCDGVTDDTAAIQAAVNAATAYAVGFNVGAQVTFNACAYKTVAAIVVAHDGIFLVGDDYGGTQIANTSNNDTVTFQKPANALIQNVGVRGIQFYTGTDDPGTSAVHLHFVNAGYVSIINVLAHNKHRDLQVDGGLSGQIVNSTFLSDDTWTGIKSGSAAVYLAALSGKGPSGWQISNSNINGGGFNFLQDGLFIEAADGLLITNSHIGFANRAGVHMDPTTGAPINTVRINNSYIDGFFGAGARHYGVLIEDSTLSGAQIGWPSITSSEVFGTFDTAAIQISGANTKQVQLGNLNLSSSAAGLVITATFGNLITADSVDFTGTTTPISNASATAQLNLVNPRGYKTTLAGGNVTWNNGALDQFGIDYNVTNTASGGNSALIRLQTGGATQFSVSPSGFTLGQVMATGSNFQVPNQWILSGGGSTGTGVLTNYAGSAGIGLDFSTDALIKFRTRALTGDASISAKTVLTTPVTVASLPTCNSAAKGTIDSVSDGTAALAWGATVTGGASTPYSVFCNGTNWTVAGK